MFPGKRPCSRGLTRLRGLAPARLPARPRFPAFLTKAEPHALLRFFPPPSLHPLWGLCICASACPNGFPECPPPSPAGASLSSPSHHLNVPASVTPSLTARPPVPAPYSAFFIAFYHGLPFSHSSVRHPPSPLTGMCATGEQGPRRHW